MTDESASILRTHGLCKHYGAGPSLLRAVDDVDVEIHRGETVVISGPSGCGKSTLLHLLGGLDRPSEGEVWLDEARVDTMGQRAKARLRRDRIGFVFQAFHLMEELTARENVELPALLAGTGFWAARQAATALLDQVGLIDHTDHLPSQLSGGQRQRVGIARALVNRPDVLLADEPTGNLDSAATTDVLRLLDRLRAGGPTIVMVTHDARVAATADRLLSMRDGRIIDETILTGGSRGGLGQLAGLEN